MDLSKLTPEPWEAVRQADLHTLQPTGTFILAHGNLDIAEFRKPSPAEAETNADFTALARKAFDVMMRRGWGVKRYDNERWGVYVGDPVVPWVIRPGMCCKTRDEYAKPFLAADPYTALVEADAWYVENVERKTV